MSDSGPEGEPQGQKPNWLQRIFLRFGGKRQGDTVIATIGQSNRNIVVGKNIINIGKLNVSVWHLSALIVIILVGTVTLIYFNRRTNSTAGEILTLLQSPTATLTPSVTPTPTISPTPSPTATTTPTPLPKMNSGRVRVAVTAIGYQDENGVVTPLSNRDVGNNLGEALKTAMEDEKRRNFTNVSSDYFNVGWYPSEVIVGDSEAVREQNAAKLAQLVYANLVVYGYVEPKNNQWQLHLYFYYFDPEIREEPDAVSSGQLLGEAMVMLANPTTQPDRAIGDISDELNLRARALTWLAVGLYDDSIRKWEEAREIFRLGQEKLSAPQIGSKRLADDPNIQAIFHYFIGRESLWLRDYDNAISEQEMAIAANPNYANAYHALGVIYFDRAQVFFSQISSAQEAEQCAQGADRAQAANDDDDAWNYTVKAQAELSKTLDLAAVDEASAANGTPAEGEAPNWSHVASVAHLSLGLVQQLQAQVYFRDGELGDVEPSLNAAKSEFEEALTGFSVEPPRTSYIGWSHFGLGLYYSIRADLADQGVSTDGQTPTELLQGAVKEYQACIDRQVADSNSFFNQKVINCGCKAYLSEAEEKLQQVAPPAMTPAESSP